MAHYPPCRVLAIVGSGETSPTMVTVHRDLVARLRLRRPRGLLLSTPYAFQENAASVSARAQRYFADSVGLQVSITPGTNREAGPETAPPVLGEGPAGPLDQEPADRDDNEKPAPQDYGPAGSYDHEAARIRAADWVFAGPGSPSYALAHWHGGPVEAALRERILAGHGLTVLASAAAATAGQFAVPVYEIYKAGGALRWLPGLDLLGALGLKAAVIPHYDNAEGGHYDTRHCYLGARRLAIMERELPADAAVLGVDEHTAVLIDLRIGGIEVRGRGALTVRRSGRSTILPAGTAISLSDLRALVRGDAGDGDGRGRARKARGAEDSPGDGAGGTGTAEGTVPLPLPELMAGAERRFGVAAGDRDADAMVEVVLELETAIRRWEADTDEDRGTEQARGLLRSLIGRLGLAARDALAARDGLADPGDRLRTAVEPLIALRGMLRSEGDFTAADTIRDALAAAGLEVTDTPQGTRWQGRRDGLAAARFQLAITSSSCWLPRRSDPTWTHYPEQTRPGRMRTRRPRK